MMRLNDPAIPCTLTSGRGGGISEAHGEPDNAESKGASGEPGTTVVCRSKWTIRTVPSDRCFATGEHGLSGMERRGWRLVEGKGIH